MSFDRSRSRWALALVIALVVSWASRAAADPAPAGPSLLSPAEVRWLEQRGWLERDPARVLRALGPYAERVTGPEHVRLDDVRVAHIEALECVLGRVAAARLGVAQFFTDPLFRAGGGNSVVVLLDPTTLSVLDQIFDLHTIFPPTVTPAPPAAPVHEQAVNLRPQEQHVLLERLQRRARAVGDREVQQRRIAVVRADGHAREGMDFVVAVAEDRIRVVAFRLEAAVEGTAWR